MENPMEQLCRWLEDAKGLPEEEGARMVLSTVGENGRPSSRVVLVKNYDSSGLVFYTNLRSRKARELDLQPYVSLCFHWSSLNRQIRVEGRVELVSDAEADAYFASRPRMSQIGAWASKQSSPASELELEKRVAYFTAKFGSGPVPRPPFWGGFRVVPDYLEFWEVRKFRLHFRECFRLTGEGWEKQWTKQRLFP
ncbi:MAG: pyridoxamine 5'-phosphate oxidase [Deltaproteobacteria bacterium]|nr:pyridoxamine 5'-phosphate oxidase [Deltaproteobacteria bacterium]